MKQRFFVFCKRWVKRLAVTFGICLGLLIVLLGGLLVFLGTETGLVTLVDLASKVTNGQFSVQKASGSLYSKASLQGLRYTDTGLELSLDELHLDWDATQLWQRHFSVQDIHVSGLRLFMAPGAEEPAPEDSEPFSLPAIDLPVRITLGRLLVNNFSLFSQQDAEKPDFELKEALVQGLVFADQRLDVEHIALENKEILLQAQVEAQSIESWPLQLDLKYQYAMEDMPLVSGQAKLNGSLSDLLLETELQSPAPLIARVELADALDNLRWNLRLTGGADLAKIMADLPDVRISSFLLTGQGSTEEYELDVQLSAVMKELGEEALHLSSELRGNLKGVNLQSFQLSHKQAKLAAQGEVAWEPQLAWQARIQASHLDPSFLLSEWPADINLNLQTSGQIQGEGLAGVQAELLLAELSGKLRGFPLQGKGKLTLQEGQLHIPDFVLACAGSSLRLQGDYAEKANLRFDLNSPDLQALVPEVKGKITAKGQLGGTPEQLEVDLQAQADDLFMTAGNADTGLKKLRLQAKGMLSADRFPQIQLQAGGLQSGETIVDAVALSLDGSVANNQLKLDVKSKDGNVHIGLKGKADMEKMTWNGQIHDTRIDLPQVGTLQQKQASALQLSASEVQLAPFCLEMKEGSFCLNASLLDDTWQAQTKVDRLDLALLKKFPAITLPPAIKQYGGIVVADLKASGQGPQARQANLDLSLKDLFLVLAADGKNKEQRLQWEKNQIQLSYANNKLNASLHSNLPQKASIGMNLQVDKVDLAQPDHLLQSPIQGRMQLNVRDFALINQLSEDMVNITGTLQGNVGVSNTLTAPILVGQIELAGGKVTVTPLGIALSPLSLQIQSNAKQEMQLRAQAKSGEGEIQVNTSLHMQKLNMDKATITVKGENFQAMNLPELAVLISPDLNIQINEKQMSIRGSVTVPSANISSTIDTSSAIGVSDDVVVIDDEEALATTPGLPMYLRVKVIFGDDVRMNAYGLRGRIVGHLEVSGEPKRPMLGTGTLKVEEGTFTFMSKRLGLDLSRLLFSNGPLDNPGVDLRVETNDGKIKAGLTVQGTLRRQEINLYSTPSMDQFTILRHLLENTAIAGETREDVGIIGDVAEKAGMGGAVPYLQALKKFSMIDEIRLDTGDDFDSASLVFGSWLTPDFYISYGKSLMDETSTFNTRYTIGKGFFLTTNASSTASGGDIKYELER